VRVTHPEKPYWPDDGYTKFVAPETEAVDTGDLRSRLTDLNNNGRLANWRVALDAAHDHPWRGVGAGTYQLLWEQGRPRPPVRVVDGHSLYFETRGELGWIGVVLLAIVFAVPLGVAASRLGGSERHAYAGFITAAVVLLMHANVDWDW